MAAIQADVHSLQATAIVGELVRPAAGGLTDRRAVRAADLLLGWDGEVRADSPAAAIYHLFYQELLHRAIRPAQNGARRDSSHATSARCTWRFRRWTRRSCGASPPVFPDGPLLAVEQALTAAWEAATARWDPIRPPGAGGTSTR